MNYRADIDGLRAVAIAAVILCHAHIPGVAGGFIGVDVFFVISGYLITLLLMEPGTASIPQRLKTFYVRRCRRILPALIVVSLVVAAAGAILLLPLDLRRLGKFLMTTPVFLGNIAAWSEGSYFNAGLCQVALNHLWSIAVEEQFYLAYPLVWFVAIRHMPRFRAALLTGLAVVSLALCIWASYTMPVPNYYLAPPRAWELLLGALIAVHPAWRFKRAISEGVAALCMAAILMAVCFYSPDMRYPGVATLVPCVATAVLIAIGRQGETRVTRWLSFPPLVFTGLISYSLYLWHWPVLAFFNYYTIEQPGLATRCLLIAVIFLLSVVSWKWVEKPWRHSYPTQGSSRRFMAAAASASVAVLIIGVAFWRAEGLPGRFDSTVRTLADSRSDIGPDVVRCAALPADRLEAGDFCRYGPEGRALPTVLVWGDSHTIALLPAYKELAEAHRVRLYFAVAPACGPLLGVEDGRRYSHRRPGCDRHNRAVAQGIDRLQPDRIILAGYWNHIDALLGSQTGLDIPPAQTVFRGSLEYTVRRISAPGRSVYVVLDVPTLKYPLPYAVAMAHRRGIDSSFAGIDHASALRQVEDTERAIHEIEAMGLARTLDPKAALCHGGACAVTADGRPLYRDTNHLTVAGARYVMESIAPGFRGLAAHRAASSVIQAGGG